MIARRMMVIGLVPTAADNWEMVINVVRTRLLRINMATFCCDLVRMAKSFRILSIMFM